MGIEPFCIAPWMHLHLEQTGLVRPCCMYLGEWADYLGNINEQTWEEIWKGERFQNIRKKFLEATSVPETCVRCIQYEEAGGYSLRRGCRLLVPTIGVPAYIEKPKIVSLDIRLSSICSGACCQCNEWNSTAWARELGKEPIGLTDQGIQNVLDLVRQNKNSIRKIAIAGGETLMIPSTFEILDILKERGFAGDIALFFNTNGALTGVDGYNIFDFLNYFTQITAEVSLDAVGKAAEYIRYNIPWKKVETNLEQYYKWFKSNPLKARLTVHPTVFVHSVLRIPEMLEFLDERYPDIEVIPGNFLNEPKYFDLQRVPQDLKDFIVEKLEEWEKRLKIERSKTYVRSMINYLQAQTDKEPMWEECKKQIEILDTRRHNSFLEINPEFKPWFE